MPSGEAVPVEVGSTTASEAQPNADGSVATAEGAAGTPVLSRYDFSEPDARFDLPGRLDEISGLALTVGGRLLGHDDERGRVYEIDPVAGEVGKRFDLGSGNVLDDFEGIAAVGERLFLVSSTGFLYEFREGADGADVPYRVTDTGVGSACEVEGLDYDADAQALLLACKRTDRADDPITLYSLPVAGGAPNAVGIRRADLPAFGLEPGFQPSAVAVTDEGTWLLLSAVTESILEVNRGGTVLAGAVLPRDRHPQPEGLALGRDGVVYIADEQNGDDAHIAVYHPTRGSR